MPPTLDVQSESASVGEEARSPSEKDTSEFRDDGVGRRMALEQKYIELLEKRVAALEALIAGPESKPDVGFPTFECSTLYLAELYLSSSLWEAIEPPT